MKNTHYWGLHFDLILTKSARVLRNTQWDVLSGCWQLWGCRDGLCGERQRLCCQLQQTLSRTQLSLAAKCDPWQSRQELLKELHTWEKPTLEQRKGVKKKRAERETAVYQLPQLHGLLVTVEEFGVKKWRLGRGEEKCCSNVCLPVSHSLSLYQLTISTKMNLFSLWQ